MQRMLHVLRISPEVNDSGQPLHSLLASRFGFIYRLLCGQLHVGHNGDLQCDFGSVCGYHHEGFVVMSDLFAATCVNFTQPV